MLGLIILVIALYYFHDSIAIAKSIALAISYSVASGILLFW